MIKNVIFAVLQFVLFLLIFAAGSFFPPFHLQRVLSVTPDGTRIFIWDGFLLMLGAFVLILVIEQLRKRLARAGVWTTIAFVLAAAVGLAMKLGFLTQVS